MLLAVDKQLIGSDLNLIFNLSDGTYQGNSEIPHESNWIISKNIQHKDLLTALELIGIKLNTDPPKKWRKAFLAVSNCSDGPWQKIMPEKAWNEWVCDLLKQITHHASMCDLSYYQDVYCKSQSVFESLVQTKINKEKLQYYIDNANHLGVKSRLKSFEPKEDGFTNPIKYDLLKTISGRMLVKSGPEILHLNKEYRDIFKSRWENGEIVQIDYTSLEPRIALALAGKEVPEDVYEDINEKIFGGQAKREHIKLFVLSTLYGAGAHKISEETGISEDICRNELFPKMKEYFGVKEITKKLLKEVKKNKGKIKNYFGRVIIVNDPKAHKLYNHYIQSTAVDCAMLGFKQIIDSFDLGLIKPIFVIHDALLLDIKEKSLIHSLPKKININFPVQLLLESDIISA